MLDMNKTLFSLTVSEEDARIFPEAELPQALSETRKAFPNYKLAIVGSTIATDGMKVQRWLRT